MKTPSSLLKALGLVLALAIAPAFPAHAQADAPAVAQIEPTGREAVDDRVVQAAVDALTTGGFKALGEHKAALEAVLVHAPASYPKLELRGDVVVVRTDNEEEALRYREAAKTFAEKAGRKMSGLAMAPNTYITASFLLGSYANEMHQWEEAAAVLAKGLALQPNDPVLTVERSGALISMKRAPEALASYEALLKADEPNLPPYRARVLRNQGVALIEVDRLDEAEAALNKSLELEPGHRIALGELAYIRQLRAGGATAPFELKTPDKTKPPQQDHPAVRVEPTSDVKT